MRNHRSVVQFFIGLMSGLVLSGASAAELSFASAQVVNDTSADPVFVRFADIDGDNKGDVIVAHKSLNRITWNRNSVGDGSAWTEQIVNTSSATGVRAVSTGDVDGDGDNDVVGALQTGDAIVFYRNVNGSGSLWSEITVNTTAADGAISVAIGDIDGDGDADIASASFNDKKLAWYENAAINGDGSMWTEHVISASENLARYVVIADIDGDGNPDIVFSSFLGQEIGWFKNTLGGVTDWTKHVVRSNIGDAISLSAADVDGDGDLDIVSARSTASPPDPGDPINNPGQPEAVVWFENTDGAGLGPWTERKINQSLYKNVQSVDSADIDGDGDIDVLSASLADNMVVWHENLDSKGTVWNDHTISGTATGAISATVADVDNDGDADVVVAENGNNRVMWHKNTKSDLAVVVNDDTDPVQVGANVTYTATVTNNGPDTATGVVLTNTIPAGGMFVSANPPQGSCSHNAGVVTCNLGSLIAGQMTAVGVTVTAPSTAGTAMNAVTVSANTADPDGANDSDSEDTTVDAAGGGSGQPAKESGGGAFGPLGLPALFGLRRLRRARPVR